MRSMAGGLWVALLAGLVLGAFSGPAAAGEFKRYKKSDPVAFAKGVEAYDRKDYAEAFAIWLPLAQHQDPAAMRNVAHLLRRGLGVEKDPKRAIVFYKRAAGFGLVGAQANLALMYYEGEGTKRDAKEAARWFLAAAKHGHVLSQYQLGLMLEAGDGIPQNPAAAKIFFQAAAKGGYEPAAQRLAALEGGTATGSPVETATLEPPAVKPGGKPAVKPGAKPRQKPEDAGALAAAFLLRGSLTENADALEMAPDEIWTLRASFSEASAEEALLGFSDEEGAAQVAWAAGACSNPASPFDRGTALCRMPPVWD